MTQRSRIDAARRRATALKRVLAGAAAAAFVVTGFAARASHHGQTTRSGSTQGSSRSTAVTSDGESESQDDFAIAPSTAQPQAQTNVS